MKNDASMKSEDSKEKSMWSIIFKEVAKVVATLIAKEGTKKGLELAPGFFSKVKKWWEGKCIAIIGPTASGKNSFFSRLKNEEIPSEHIQTRSAENVEVFNFKYSLPDKTSIEFKCKNSINIGGEIDERERRWLKACKNADVIFYLIDYEKLSDKIKEKREEAQERIEDDFRWLKKNISEFKAGHGIYILINKVDENPVEKIKPHLENLEISAHEILRDDYKRIDGVYPICMKDEYLFKTYFTEILQKVAQSNALT